MTTQLYREWIRIAYHCGGMSLREYLGLSRHERYGFNRELNRLIDHLNEHGDPKRGG